jgi:GMP synthase-like glutamine amidotransferase
VARVRILVIANLGDDDPGYVGEALRVRGADLVVAHRDAHDDLPPPDGFAAVVSLGSDWSVYWAHVADHVGREVRVLQAATAAGTPVLGLCYGGQLLAHALGGTVERAPFPEIGWYAVDSDVPDLVPTGPYVQWHSDRFTSPPGALELARSAAGPQAFVLGRALGLQFHPEATPEVVRRWVVGMADQADGAGVDAEAFTAECDRRDGEARDRADRIVATFLAGIPAEAVRS